ncbi:BT_3987 domain-containing protein [Dysgonomonas reticulitermitis]
MKTKIFLLPILLVGVVLFSPRCSEGNNFDPNKKVLMVTGTGSNPVVKFLVENVPSTYPVTVSASDKVAKDVVVTLEHDPSLVEAYNAANKTTYYPVPASSITLDGTQVVIEAGKASSSVVNVRVVDDSKFEGVRIYLVPITIKDSGGMDVLKSSKTIYLRISRTVGFPSLDISSTTGAMNSNFYFTDAQAIPRNNAFTYEIKFLANAWKAPNLANGASISRLCAFEQIDESKAIMLRFGEAGSNPNILQVVNPIGGFFCKTEFEAGRWYTLSFVYNGKGLAAYVDGVKDTEVLGTMDGNFQRFELGMSWASTYRQRQYFPGRIAEIRVWTKALSANQIQLGNCGVDPGADGLAAYWKLDEGTGWIFHDATGHGYDMDWSNTWRAPGENDPAQIDLRTQVKWVEDNKNICVL